MRGCLFHPLTHRFPVYYAPEGIDVVGAFVLIIQVVGMLPNVEAQQRGQSCAYGIASVRFFGDVQLAVLINRQPCPARTEQSDCCRVEFLLEILETAEVAFDGFRQFPGRFALRRFRCELQEVQRMVQHLSGIVEYGAIGCSGYDSNQVFVFILRARNKVVQVVYVRLQVLTVMVIYCLLTDYRLKTLITYS